MKIKLHQLEKDSIITSLILNLGITTIFIVLLFISYKTISDNQQIYEIAYKSQFLSRITLKASVGVSQSNMRLWKAKQTRDKNAILEAEDFALGAKSNYNLLLSDQIIQDTPQKSAQYEELFEEIIELFGIVLDDETKDPFVHAKEIDRLIDVTRVLTNNLLNEEGMVWAYESKKLLQYKKLKNRNIYIFYGLTICFVFTQLLMIYLSIVKHNLIKKVNTQKDQMIQQTRLSTLGLMSAELAHEINSPLMVIDGRLKIVQNELSHASPNNEKINKNIDIIKRNSQRIHGIIKSFKTMASTGENDSYENFTIRSIIEEVKEITQYRISLKKITLIIPHDLEKATAYGNKVQIVQVLTNLINNSIDAIRTLEERWIKIDVSIQEENNLVYISITDSGKGIPQENQAKIFQAFYSTKASNDGTGLGLSISKKIIIEHEGDLYLNKESANTQFTFFIKHKKAQS